MRFANDQNGALGQLSWPEFEQSATIGFRRALNALKKSYADDEKLARAHFSDHIHGAVAEKFVSKALGVPWPAHLVPNRELGDMLSRSGTPLEVRTTEHLDGHLLIHTDDLDHHVAILVVGKHPNLLLAGWLRVSDGKQPQFWGNPRFSRPCWAIPRVQVIPFAQNKDRVRL